MTKIAIAAWKAELDKDRAAASEWAARTGTRAEWNRQLAEHIASFPADTTIVRVSEYPDQPMVTECLVPWEFSDIYAEREANRVGDR